MFESSVNSEGIEAKELQNLAGRLFESSVNSEGIEAIKQNALFVNSLRAV